MKRELKRWFGERGLTASKVADNIGVDRKEFYLVLDGKRTWWMDSSIAKVHYALTHYYGMTDAEFRSFIQI